MRFAWGSCARQAGIGLLWDWMDGKGPMLIVGPWFFEVVFGHVSGPDAADIIIREDSD